MNILSCKYHENKKALFIVWNSNQLMFICEECMSSNLIDVSARNNQWKILSIEKAMKEPDYFFSQFELNEINKIRMNALQKNSLEEMKHLIENMEKHIQEIQCILDRIINDLKLEVLNIKENKENHRKQLEQVYIIPKQVQQYQFFRTNLKELYNPQNYISQEMIFQCEINLKQLCHSLEKNPVLLNQQLERILINCKINRIQQFSHLNQLKEQLLRIQQLTIPFKNKLNPKSFIQYDFLEELFARISLNSKKIISQSDLIFNGRDDRLNAMTFWNKVQNKENLLMIFKSNNNYIFGGYSPCKWIYTKNKSYADKTKTSFIFSKNNSSFHPIAEKDYKAIHCDQTKGPCFGYCENEGMVEYDLSIAEDFQDGCSYLGNNYVWQNIKSQKLNCHLFGQIKPKIIDCEIYQIKFK